MISPISNPEQTKCKSIVRSYSVATVYVCTSEIERDEIDPSSHVSATCSQSVKLLGIALSRYSIFLLCSQTPVWLSYFDLSSRSYCSLKQLASIRVVRILQAFYFSKL